MKKSTSKDFSANEKEISRLLRENRIWKDKLNFAAEEINFLNMFLNADIFQEDTLNLYEKLQGLRSRLENFKTENMDLSLEVHNNGYDIEGIRECEDIGCEVFYHEEHLKLEQRIRTFLKDFRKFRLEIFNSTGKLLRKNSKKT